MDEEGLPDEEVQIPKRGFYFLCSLFLRLLPMTLLCVCFAESNAALAARP